MILGKHYLANNFPIMKMSLNALTLITILLVQKYLTRLKNKFNKMLGT